MFRALLWKEWREQRLVVAAGLVVAALMPFIIEGASRLGSRRPVADLMPQALMIAYALFLWPMLAGVTAGATIAGEIGERTIDFLFSRPVRRSTIWGAKVAMAIASFAAIVAGSIGILAFVGLPLRAEISLPALDLPGMTGIVLLLAAAALTLIFACSVFFSSLLSRPLHATLLGIFSAVLLLAAIALVWSRLDLMPALEPQWMALDVLLSAGLLLLCSLVIFTRGESLRDGRARRLGVMGGLVTLAAAIVVVPYTYAHTRLTPAMALLADMRLSPTRDAVAVTAVTDRGLHPEAWLVRPDRTGVQRVGGRLTFRPVLFPDGKRVAYLSQRDALGLRSDRASLHVVSSDGSGDRLLLDDLDAAYPVSTSEPVVSPGNDRVAVLSGRTLHVSSVDTPDRLEVPLPANRWGSPRIVAWSRRGDEVFVLDSSRDMSSTATLTAISVPEGRKRTLFEERDASAWPPFEWSPTTSKGCSVIPLVVRHRSPEDAYAQLVLIRADGEEPIRPAAPACSSAVSITSDERTLAYASCQVAPRGKSPAEVRVVDLRTGVDRVAAEVPGFPLMMTLSPAGDRIAVGLFDKEQRTLSTAIVDIAGAVKEISGDWIPLGWLGRDRLALAGTRRRSDGEARDSLVEGVSRLGIADASTGAIEAVYP